jgi:hypothetical protein
MKNEEDVCKELDAVSSGELTELERTKLENYALKHNLVQQQLQRIVVERTEYVKQIEENHSGYKWDEQTASLVKLPVMDAD